MKAHTKPLPGELMKLYGPRLWDEASPADIIAAFNELPLWTRMRAFYRRTIPEVDKRNGGPRPHALDWPKLADIWDREDAEKAQRDTEIEELAEYLAIHIGGYSEDDWEERTKPNTWYDHAERLIRVGRYRKQSTEAAGLHDCEYDDPRMCAWPGHRKAQS